MKIVKKQQLNVRSGEGVIAPVFVKSGVDHVTKEFPRIKEWLKKKKISGKLGEDAAIALIPGDTWLCLLGAGHPEPGDARKLAKRIIQTLKENRIERAILFFPPQVRLSTEYLLNLTDYLHMNHYAFDRYLKKKKWRIREITVVPGVRSVFSQNDIMERNPIIESTDYIRNLVNETPSLANPDYLTTAFRQLAKEKRLSCEIWKQRELEKRGMNGLLSVGRAGCSEPALVILRHEPASYSRTVALVGKGITFDSGGLSIKTTNTMEEMKCDMAGAALVAGIVRCAASLKLPVRVIALAAIAENMPGSCAYKPGDIITYANGKTVEIVNTDAEGRLVLADALIVAARLKPDAIIEFSTLTGAMVVALGDSMAGLMTKNRGLASALLASSQRTGEFLWEMPFFEDYREAIRSKVADIKNANYQGAGAIKAGLFLSEFVGKTPFAHIDMAGTAFLAKPNPYFVAEGATAFGLRLTIDFLMSESR